jgi:uncharacterized LabA/DUF88 family protein
MQEAKRLAVFIDASNLWQAQKTKGQFIDYKKLLLFLRNISGATIIKVFYYTAYPANATRDYDLSGKHKFYTYLKKGLGFTVIKKELKQIKTLTSSGIVYEEKGNMDVELTIDAVDVIDEYDEAILCTGDSDFLALVRYMHVRGKFVRIVSSRNNVSRELLSGGDAYIDVLETEEDIWMQKAVQQEPKADRIKEKINGPRREDRSRT